MRTTRQNQHAEASEMEGGAAETGAVDAGQEQQTRFTTQGAIPDVAPDGEASAEGAQRPSASELAFGDGPATAGNGRAAAGAADGSGQPLSDELRAKFEPSLGADLSGVRIHTEGNAAADTKGRGAKAITTGSDIAFAPGQYDPHSEQGQQLIAHELAHVVQQRDAGAAHSQSKQEVAPASDRAEVEADQAADAMMTGAPAQVSPVTQQAPHAKGEPTWNELIGALDASLRKMDWPDVARRLNGLQRSDIQWYLSKKMSSGQVAHVREVSPQWSAVVTEEIDLFDGNAKKIAELYVAYEQAVVKAHASGDWHEVIDRLNGMGEWDQQDRLKKLTWFDYEKMRAQTDNKRVLAAIDKADTGRVARIEAAYNEAVAQQDWVRVANQLHGMNVEGIRAKLEALATDPEKKHFLKRIKAAAPKDRYILDILEDVAKQNGLDVPDPVSVGQLCPIPDVSDDIRALEEVGDFSKYGGSAAVAKFVTDLETAYNARRKESGRTDKTQTDTQMGDHFASSFQNTGTHYSKNVSPKMKFSTFAHHWMSEIRERADENAGTKLDFAALPSGLKNIKLDPSELTRLAGNKDPKKGPVFDDGQIEDKHGNIVKKGQPVHPFVNTFMENLKGKGVGFTASTYPGHGGMGPDVAALCLDVMPSIGRDERGLYQPDQMLEFIEKINDAAGAGNWSGSYNDTTVLRELPKRGLKGKVESHAIDGKNDWHGALNLHIHLFLRPPEGYVPAAPKVDPSKESP